jgi:hypothetical protein
MPAVVSIGLTNAQRGYLEGLLPDPKQLKSALYQTVNRTAGNRGTVVTAIRKIVKEQTTIRPAKANALINGKMVSADPPKAEIRISGKSLRLSDYKMTGTKKGGVTATPIVGKGSLRFPYAFAANVKAVSAGGDVSNHRGGFFRTTHLPTKGPNTGGYRTVNGKKYKLTLTPQGKAGALSVKQLFGPPLSKVVGDAKILQPAIDKVASELQRQMQSQIDRFLKAKK